MSMESTAGVLAPEQESSSSSSSESRHEEPDQHGEQNNISSTDSKQVTVFQKQKVLKAEGHLAEIS